MKEQVTLKDPDGMEEAPPGNIINELKYKEYSLKGTDNKLYNLRIFYIDNSMLLFHVKSMNNLNHNLYKIEISLEEFYKLNSYFRQYSTCEELYSILFSNLKNEMINISEEKNNIELKLLVGRLGHEILITLILNPEKSIMEKIMWNLCDKIKIIEENKTYEFDLFKKNIEDLIKNKEINKNKNQSYNLLFKDIIYKNRFTIFIILFCFLTEIFLVRKINEKEKDMLALKNEINNIKNYIYNNNMPKKAKKSDKIYNGIIKLKELYLIENEIKKNFNRNISSYQLLYRASRDGFGAKDFHRKCDGRGYTLIIVKTTSGKRFGGFTEDEWDQCSEYKNGKKGFVFSLDNKKIYYNNYGKYNIYCNKNNGPSFRSGPHDFTIWDNSNINDNSFEYTRNNTNNYVLEGNKNFIIKDYEVYTIELE